MKLQYEPDEDFEGRWYASTDDGGYDAVGHDPLSAVSTLCNELEGELIKRDMQAEEASE